MIGLGLLGAIPAGDIVAGVDQDDANGGGISSRASVVPTLQDMAPMLRRFGLKAGAATVMDQSAGAFAGDMGLSTRLHADLWGDCRTTPDGQEDGLRDGLEGDRQILDLVTFYARKLAVPERRAIDEPVVLRILWHGGEAAVQRDAAAALPKPDRDALIAFLESL